MYKQWKVLSGWSTVQGQWLKRRYFNQEVLAHLAEKIRQSELGHSGELVLAVEAVMPDHEQDSHQRALEVFGRLRVWDTPLNSGVLLYLALDQKRIEIIADRGIEVPQEQWQQICQGLREHLSQRQYLSGLVVAVEQIEALLMQAAPAACALANEANHLPDAPVLL